MKLIVKELQGREIEVNVADDTKIFDIKREIEKQLGLAGKFHQNL